MTATRSTVSRASAGWRDLQVSVLVMFSVRKVGFGSDIGRSLSHLLKALIAKVGGMCSASQGFIFCGSRWVSDSEKFLDDAPLFASSCVLFSTASDRTLRSSVCHVHKT